MWGVYFLRAFLHQLFRMQKGDQETVVETCGHEANGKCRFTNGSWINLSVSLFTVIPAHRELRIP